MSTPVRKLKASSNLSDLASASTARTNLGVDATGVNVPLAGGTMTGLLEFSGTTHAGIKLISLTTAQRDALTPANGMLIYNSTTGALNQYVSGSWVEISSASFELFDENPVSPVANSVSNDNSWAIGSDNTVSGYAAAALGNNCEATGDYSLATGAFAKADKHSQFARSGINFSGTVGSAQTSALVAIRGTTDETQSEMLLDGNGGDSRITLPNTSTYAFKILVVARRTDADGENDAWEFTGLIHRDANAASTTRDALQENQIGATAWSVAVDADTTNGALRIRVTGEAAKSIRWVATITTSEVTE